MTEVAPFETIGQFVNDLKGEGEGTDPNFPFAALRIALCNAYGIGYNHPAILLISDAQDALTKEGFNV